MVDRANHVGPIPVGCESHETSALRIPGRGTRCERRTREAQKALAQGKDGYHYECHGASQRGNERLPAKTTSRR